MGEMPKVRSGAGIEVHAISRHATLPSIPMGSSIQKLSKPYWLRIFMQISS